MSEEVTDVIFKYPGCISVNLNGKFTSDTLVNLNILDENDNKEEPIYETLKPDEILILYKDSEGIMYVTNKDGVLFITKLVCKI